MKHFLVLKNLLIPSAFMLFTNAAAQQSIETDRPDQTEATSIVPIRFLQLESGFLFEKTDHNNIVSLHPTV